MKLSYSNFSNLFFQVLSPYENPNTYPDRQVLQVTKFITKKNIFYLYFFRWLSIGQLDGLTDNVFKHWMDHANLKELISLDLDASDNLTEEMIYSFVSSHGLHLQGM